MVPEEAGPEQLGMQIGASTVTWQSGVPLVFDDCFVHSVWNRTVRERVVLLFDIWWDSGSAISCMLACIPTLSVVHVSPYTTCVALGILICTRRRYSQYKTCSQMPSRRAG